MSSFWEKKIALSQQGKPARRYPQRVDPALLPRGIGLDHERALNHYLSSQQQSSQEQDEVEGIDVAAALQHSGGDPNGYGGSHKATGRCPNCGSANYFVTRSGAATTESGSVVYPSPKCFDCGYPRLQGALSIPTESMPGVQAARQGATPQPSAGSLGALQQVGKIG